MSYTTLKYHDPVKTDYVNRRFKHIRPIGIYRGGIITYSNPYESITISKFIAEIADTTGADNQAKYYHSENKAVSISGLVNPYIVLRWTHTTDENTDVPEFLAITNEALITENDIIFCQLNTVAKTVDYTKRTTPRGSDYNLKVQPSFTDSASVVEIMPGYVYVYPTTTTGKTSKRINFTYFPISASVENYIYVSSAGTLMYATSKTALLDTNNTLLAVISKASGSDVINEKHITDYRSFVHLDVNPDNYTLENNSTTGKIQIKDEGVTTAKLQTSGVTSSKIADGAVIKGKILGGSSGNSAVDNVTIEVNTTTEKLQIPSTARTLKTPQTLTQTSKGIPATKATTAGFFSGHLSQNAQNSTGAYVKVYMSPTSTVSDYVQVSGMSTMALTFNYTAPVLEGSFCVPVPNGYYFKAVYATPTYLTPASGEVIKYFWTPSY